MPKASQDPFLDTAPDRQQAGLLQSLARQPQPERKSCLILPMTPFLVSGGRRAALHGRDTDFLECTKNVILHGMLAQSEFIRDLFVVEPAGREDDRKEMSIPGLPRRLAAQARSAVSDNFGAEAEFCV